MSSRNSQRDVIAAAESFLAGYPAAKCDYTAAGIKVLPASGTGFAVAIHAQDGIITVSFDGWHEQFDSIEDAMRCFRFGLGTSCRLCIEYRGALPTRWTVEYQKDGSWIADSQTGLLLFPFWRRPRLEYRQNSLVPSSDAAPPVQSGPAACERPHIRETNMATWDRLLSAWPAADVGHRLFTPEEADAWAKAMASNTDEDWDWLRKALKDDQKKWFVARVFASQPVPAQLLTEMCRAAVYERDVSANRQFIEPCLRAHGPRRVNELLLRYLENGNNVEKSGAASALYWSFGLNGHWGIPREDLNDLAERAQGLMLTEFVNNDDMEVRRRIIPSLSMKEECYPENLRPLVSRATSIARSHPDEYIRHRVEIQLGAGGPYMPIPTGNKPQSRS